MTIFLLAGRQRLHNTIGLLKETREFDDSYKLGGAERDRRMNWKWNNVPIPEAHLIGLAIGTALHIFWPIGLFDASWIGYVIGWPLILIGIALCSWSVLEAKEMILSSPDSLLTSGPYALSRNPMYAGWALIYAGISFAANSLWMVILLPIVILYNHFVDIRKEEQQLEERFGEEYREYQKRVRRYF